MYKDRQSFCSLSFRSRKIHSVYVDEIVNILWIQSWDSIYKLSRIIGKTQYLMNTLYKIRKMRFYRETEHVNDGLSQTKTLSCINTPV